MSYAAFTYADLSVDGPGPGLDATVTVSATVTNTSERDGTEVAQLYLHQRHGSAARPVRELKGFRRLTLAAGESQRVEFTIGPAERRFWSASTRDWALDATTFDVWVGGDSTASLAGEFEITAR